MGTPATGLPVVCPTASQDGGSEPLYVVCAVSCLHRVCVCVCVCVCVLNHPKGPTEGTDIEKY